MDTLFTEVERDALGSVAPLAVRMRPRTLDEIRGQDEVLGQGSWLRNAIEGDSFSSIILFGPAGTGKTTLARVIAAQTKAHFTEVSAISGGVSDLRRVIDEAAARLTHHNRKTILFVDEIHRFSRSQQDALLHAVEDRVVILIGATTENPAFEVNSALISRSRVIEFTALTDEDIATIITRTLSDERGLASAFDATDEARGAMVTMAGGDARSALTTLELAADMAANRAASLAKPRKGDTSKAAKPVKGDKRKAGTAGEGEKGEKGEGEAAQPALTQAIVIELSDVLEAAPRTTLPYDKKGDMHYDVISAFIKSMRGSDPDAVAYWLARMLDGGEDPKFIARRIMIFASEDVGNADPQALLVAHAAFAAVERIGLPECRINLAQAAVYMALAPKSNASYLAVEKALSEVAKGPLRQVPNHLRDRHRPGSENYGTYQYPHLQPSGYVEQQYLPDGLEVGCFYTPGERGWEAYRTEQRANDKPGTE
ncbi:MAG: replication-associated recombination protein A [Coriobacteriales bacterium]|jgi:putative ATPase|nr:replication-associated recombination protein A [Coriobacteriales bacterium]